MPARNSTTFENVCSHCYVIFETEHREQRFCSQSCWQEGRKRPITCRECGKKRMRRSIGDYCGDGCRRKSALRDVVECYDIGEAQSENGYRVHKTFPVHRLVMEAKIGRPLLESEIVHHRDGDRHNNKPTNLELCVRFQPPGQRVLDKLAWARRIIDAYAPIEPLLLNNDEPPA